MTENAAFKRAARKLAAERNISYTEARRLLLQEQQNKAQQERKEEE